MAAIVKNYLFRGMRILRVRDVAPNNRTDKFTSAPSLRISQTPWFVYVPMDDGLFRKSLNDSE